ncbi:hypothetical protein ACWDYJ_23370 [Streptomyces sp. NPDC003042]
MEPTQEQWAAREVFAVGRDLALVAGAGTGKTSTLIPMGAATRKRGLYIAFNRAIADDAWERFGRNVDCRTAHSLAFKAVGHLYRERLNASARMSARHTARLLGITHDLPVNSRDIKVPQQARLVMGMVRTFCYTTDRQVMARHMEPINGLDDPGWTRPRTPTRFWRRSSSPRRRSGYAWGTRPSRSTAGATRAM